MGGYELGVQQAERDIAQRNAQKEAQKQQQRNVLAGLYLNAVQTPLPKTDDPAYAEALKKREDLMKQYVTAVGPEQHASFGQHLHGLIFGQPQAAEPVHGEAPQPQLEDAGAPLPPPAASTPQSSHAFAHNPVYAKILNGLDTLGKHLKAGMNPLPPPAPTDYSALAAAYQSPEQRKNEAATALAEQKQKDALELADERNKGKAVPEVKQFLDSYAKKIGKPIEEWSPEDFDAANKEFAAGRKAPATPSQAALATYIRAKYGDEPTAEQIEAGTRAHQAMMNGVKIGEHQQLVFDDQGVPHVVNLHSESKTDFSAPPVSSKAPSLSANPGARAPGTKPAGAPSKTAPTSSQAPNSTAWTKGSPLVKSDKAQYDTVAKDANAKKQQFINAQKGLQNPTASSDQELIYSWVRSNIQGAGRLTNTEIQNAARIGSYGLQIKNHMEQALTGRLAPEAEQMLFADIKRSYETSQKEADDLRKQLGGPVSAQAPQVPTSDAPVVDQKLLDKLNSALKGK